MDVAIVGAGIVGAATAYALALRGVHPLVIESREPASGASGTAAGLLSPVPPPGNAEPLASLITRAADLHRALAGVLDGPATYDYAPYTAYMVAGTPEHEADLARIVASGVGEAVQPDEATGGCAWLDRPPRAAIRFASAQLDPGKLTNRLLDAAKDMGATYRHAQVTGLIGTPGRIEGVELDDGFLRAETTVVASGPWVHRAAAWLDTPLPVRPLKGQILHLRLPAPPPGGFSDPDGQYVITKPSGLVYAGTTEEEAGFDTEPTLAGRAGILKALGRYTSRLEGAQIVHETACLRPLPADGLPIIGPAPGTAGVVVAAGHGRKGILFGPVTGEAVAELITAGRCDSIDLAPFDPGRFA